jgi:DNA (cytosine-5)-methyltransferase 1
MSGELIIDNFAGGGGASTGIEMALGRSPDLAINHDREAIAMHEANHPGARHLCEDVFSVDPMEATGGRPVGLAWFSPDCKHFSKAKGGKPKSKKIRGLAWVAVRWAATVRPRVIILENVEEFQTWGPLLSDGSPCPKRKGKTFRSFVRRLEEIGYQVERRELRACDYGTPTIRKRLFLIARCDGLPIVWPEPTHGSPTHQEVKDGLLLPWRTAAECIDFTIPCPSIFERKRPLAEATLRRIARGIRKYVIDSADPFIVEYHSAKRPGDDRCRSLGDPLATQTTENRFGLAMPFVAPLTHQGSDRIESLNEPAKTITGAHRGERALITPFLTEHANGSGQRNFSAGEPLRTQCAEVKGGHFGLVSAFLAKHFTGVVGSPLSDPVHTVTATDHNALVSAHLIRHFGESTGSPLNDPAPTVVAGGLGKTGLVASHLSKLYGTTTGQDQREPMHTVTSGGNHIAEVRAFLTKYYGEGGQDQDCRAPMHTVPTKDRFAIVTVEGVDYAISDIGMRMLAPRELYSAQGFPADYIISPEKFPLTKTAQVRMCGNSVCPPMAAAIVAANVPELRQLERAA